VSFISDFTYRLSLSLEHCATTYVDMRLTYFVKAIRNIQALEKLPCDCGVPSNWINAVRLHDVM